MFTICFQACAHGSEVAEHNVAVVEYLRLTSSELDKRCAKGNMRQMPGKESEMSFAHDARVPNLTIRRASL